MICEITLFLLFFFLLVFFYSYNWPDVDRVSSLISYGSFSNTVSFFMGFEMKGVRGVFLSFLIKWFIFIIRWKYNKYVMNKDYWYVNFNLRDLILFKYFVGISHCFKCFYGFVLQRKKWLYQLFRYVCSLVFINFS